MSIHRTRVASATVAVWTAAAMWSAVAAAEITGAGSTFAYPLLAKWADAYKAGGGAAVSYQSVGSGLGIKQIQGRSVDFGASDMPLKPTELEKSDLIQFPVMIGGVVPVANVSGIAPGALKFDGTTLADIYFGTIKRWNDPALLKLNPDLKLPDQPITVVFRADGSGTTFVFTDYLSKVSPKWRETVGAFTTISFPLGISARGNEGVAATIARTPGAIGYVEYAYAKQHNLSYGLVRNSDGQFAHPNKESFQAAAANASWSKAPSYYLLLTDQPGAKTWPITGSVFVMVHKAQRDGEAERAASVFRFLDWAYRNGGKLADELDYVSMPDDVATQIRESWKQVKTADGKSLWGGSQM
jgi:phosphate transport system substrate-binding protein